MITRYERNEQVVESNGGRSPKIVCLQCRRHNEDRRPQGLTVAYNPLKLPNKIKVSSNTGTVDYIYDALRNKLAVKQGGTLKNVYCGDFVYNTSLAVDYILTPNGQLTRNSSTGAYTTQYNITDHLGNVKSVVSSSNTVLQSTDYYPFGLAFRFILYIGHRMAR